MKTDEISARGKPITNRNRVDDIVRKFKSKYEKGEVKKYYAKFDVAADRSPQEIPAISTLLIDIVRRSLRDR
jgi:hypothetical protein